MPSYTSIGLHIYVLLPLMFLSVVSVYSIFKAYGMRRPIPLVFAIPLAVMGAHQITELMTFISTGQIDANCLLETVETGSNVVTGLIVYVSLGILDRERRAKQSTAVLSRVMRHDLRTDLTVIETSIDLAKKKIQETDTESVDCLDKSKERVEDIEATANRARRLERILEDETDLRKVRLDEIIEKEVRKTHERFEEARIEARSPDEIEVIADAYLGEALRALIENGIEHNNNDNKTPHVKVRVEESKLSAVVSVEDNGPGIPEDERDLVFGREEETDLHHGDGISLFFVESLVKSYGGEVWVEDRDDTEGAVFKIRLRKPVGDLIPP